MVWVEVELVVPLTPIQLCSQWNPQWQMAIFFNAFHCLCVDGLLLENTKETLRSQHHM